MRIFHGVTGQAGQPAALASGLRALGYEASAGTIAEHRFGFAADLQIRPCGSGGFSGVLRSVDQIADDFDVFHFHTRSLICNWPSLSYPSLLDLIALKEKGKKIFFHFRGQEVRLEKEFRHNNPYHYADTEEGRALFRKMPDESKLISISYLRAVCDGLFVTDPELQTYVPDAKIVERALNPSDWPYVGVSDRKVPVIVHAPSRRGLKGTAALLDATEKLKRQGVRFELRLVEGAPHLMASSAYKDADIIVDQLRIGWYGVLAAECMALGKPVICYIRDDLWRQHGHEMPIINANPDNIVDVLAKTIGDEQERRERAARSREFFLKTHSTQVICQSLIDIYQNTPRRFIDWKTVGDFLDRQYLLKQKRTSFRGTKALHKVANLLDLIADKGALGAAGAIRRRLRSTR